MGLVVLVQRLELQLHAGQAASASALADAASLWRLRSRHAVHRPRGWRSQPPAHVPWRWGDTKATNNLCMLLAEIM